MKFQGLRDVGDPVELGAAYSDRGADELVFLDVKATLEERDTLVGVVRRVAEQLAIPFTVGGGIRDVADADELLSAGRRQGLRQLRRARARRASSPSWPRSSARRPSSSRSTPRTAACAPAPARPRRRAQTVEWAREAQERGAGEILLTSIDADGTREGDDLEITARSRDAVSIPVIASAAPATRATWRTRSSVAQAALLASILHEDPDAAHVAARRAARAGVPLRDAA